MSRQDDVHLSTGAELEKPPHTLKHLCWPALWVPELPFSINCSIYIEFYSFAEKLMSRIDIFQIG